MRYNRIPQTAIDVSAVCLGTMTFGSPVEEKDAVKLVHYALEQGVNFIDTANMYEGYNRCAGSAGGVAEEIVGKAIRGRRDSFVVATKLGMKVGNGPEDEFTSPKAIAEQLRRSLCRLGTDYVDVYYLHRYDPQTSPQAIAEAMGRELKAGTIRSWAVSNYTAPQLKALLAAAEETGTPGPSLCQPALSLLKDAAAQDLLPLCRESGIGVVPYQVLQGGLLTGKYRRGQQAAPGTRASEKPEWMMAMDDGLFDKLEGWENLAEHEGLSMTQYALRWAMQQAGVISTLVGVKRSSQIDDAVHAAELL